jgi:Adenylate and Guanylate cyclase catalytic domain
MPLLTRFPFRFVRRVERLAMPFATNVQQILKAKLGVDTVMGATYGKAYCGVVGGLERHEYAVLGPSVNLAARLMANKANAGFLVDEEVRRKASSRGFEGLAPVKAKGYKTLVPIFEPKLQHRRSWGSQGGLFVGRTSEIKRTLRIAEDVIDAGASSRMVWVSAESGYGKSALLAQATEKVQDLCCSKSATHVILCHVCSDSDSFQPLRYASHFKPNCRLTSLTSC